MKIKQKLAKFWSTFKIAIRNDYDIGTVELKAVASHIPEFLQKQATPAVPKEEAMPTPTTQPILLSPPLADVENAIAETNFILQANSSGVMVSCQMIMKNGFPIDAQSDLVPVENYDQSVLRAQARARAFAQAVRVIGYMIQENKAQANSVVAVAVPVAAPVIPVPETVQTAANDLAAPIQPVA